MAVQSAEYKFKFNKKGRLDVTYTEKEKTDAGDTITTKTPEKHDIVNADEEQKEMLFNALTESLGQFLRGGTLDYYNNED